MRSAFYVLRSAFCVLIFSTLTFGATSSSVTAADGVVWKWETDPISPYYEVVNPNAAVKTYKLKAKGDVRYLKGIIIEKVEFLVFYATESGGYEEVATTASEATLGEAATLPPTINYDYRSAEANPIKKNGATFVGTAGNKFKISVRIKYKLGPNENSITGIFEPSGFVILPPLANEG